MGPQLHPCPDTGRRPDNTKCERIEKEEVDRMETKDRRANKNQIQEKVMEKIDDNIEDDLASIRKIIETAASEVVHHTKAERTHSMHLKMLDYVGKLLQDVRRKIKRKVLKKRPESHGGTPGEMLRGTGEKRKKKTAD